MANYDVTHSCRHSRSVALYGPMRDRESKLSWMERSLCPECYQNQLQSERAKASVEAAQKSKLEGLPKLEGSPKQVAWAETIRRKILDELEESARDYEPQIVADMVDRIRLTLQSSSSKWWIDHRDRSWNVHGIVLDLARKAKSEGGQFGISRRSSIQRLGGPSWAA